MKRLFAFGCSFTSYSWPTWADILARDFDHFENWAASGASNMFILNSLNECHLKNNITHDDTVLIMWTNVYREDSYKDNAWILRGNEYGYPQPIYRFDDKGYLIRDLAFMHSSKLILDHVGCRYKFLSMVPVTNVDQYSKKEIRDIAPVLELYQPVLDAILPSVYEKVFDWDWNSRTLFPNNRNMANIRSKRFDLHPGPQEHLEYLDKVLPEFAVNNDTRKWVDLVNNEVLLAGTAWDETATYREPYAFQWEIKGLWYPKSIKRL
jgi:hypothetical protein